MNPSGISPTEFKLLIKPDKVAERTAGGVWRPQTQVEQEQAAATTGTIIAKAPLAFTYADWPEGVAPPKEGERVAFARYAGMSIKGKDGEDYRVINDKDVVAVVWEQEA